MATHDTPGSLNILLVEDNDDDVEAVRRVFARNGVAVRFRVARDGQQALDILFPDRRGTRLREVWSPHLILLDLHLPKTAGLEVLRQVKVDPDRRTIPIVVLSGSAGNDVIAECMAIGTNMYLLKPMDIGDVANVMIGLQRYWPVPAPALESEAA